MNTLIKAFTVGCFLLVVFTIKAQPPKHDYLNTNLSIEERAKDLVSKMTLEEKVLQMMNSSPGIERLNLPPYDWWNEALHGVGRSGVATVFPQAIALGATFDEDLAYRVSTAISDEARAMFNLASSKGYYKRYNGLTFWTPNINIFRDPRWGRGQETYGEDPFLTTMMGVSFVKGLQGDHPKYLKTAACAKHFAVHSGPERLRHEFDATTSQKDLFETYLPAFEALVEADVEAVMCAYNRTNGDPCCAHNYLLQDILRDQWKFEGHIVSDCWAVVDFYSDNGHGTVSDVVEASALAVNTGVNLNCGDEYPALVDAVKKGLIDEETIDASLVQLLKTRFKLGLFDPEADNPYNAISTDVINSEANRALAREAAQKSIVMLKNNGVLPLKNDLERYYVTGPNADNILSLIGNYYGINPNMVTVMEGLAAAIEPGSQLHYRPGALLTGDNVNPIDWSSSVAHTADATIMVMGINGLIEGEEGESIASEHFGDRLDYDLPKNQIDYLRKLKDGNSKPVIAIVTGGSPMNLAEVHEIADAVLLAWYPGEEGGNALADIIFGKVSPSGRLPITFPQSLDQLPAYEDYSMEGRTYKYMEKTPLYPFGFGLSYGSFEYSGLSLAQSKIKKGQSTTAVITVKNNGTIEGEEVVQLYITDVEASTRTPLYALNGLQRVKLAPGASEKIEFQIAPEMLMLIKEDGSSAIEKGSFQIHVGGSLPDERSLELGATKTQSIILQVK